MLAAAARRARECAARLPALLGRSGTSRGGAPPLGPAAACCLREGPQLRPLFSFASGASSEEAAPGPGSAGAAAAAAAAPRGRGRRPALLRPRGSGGPAPPPSPPEESAAPLESDAGSDGGVRGARRAADPPDPREEEDGPSASGPAGWGDDAAPPSLASSYAAASVSTSQLLGLSKRLSRAGEKVQ